jgi:hypothetical protein
MPSLTIAGPAMLMMGTLLTAFGAEAADHPTGEHIKSVEPFAETLVNPCNGEAIVFSGEAVLQVTQVDDRHLEFFTSAEGIGTGPESGATYTYHLDAAHENRNSVNGQEPTFASGANARVYSDLPGLSFTSHFVFHSVTLPFGEIKVIRSVDRTECKD